MNFNGTVNTDVVLTWERQSTLPEIAVGLWIRSLVERGKFSAHVDSNHPELIAPFAQYLATTDTHPQLSLKENMGGVSMRAEFPDICAIDRRYPLPFVTAIGAMLEVTRQRMVSNGGFRRNPNGLFSSERDCIANYMSGIQAGVATASYPLFGKILKTGLIQDAVRRVNGIQATTDAAKDLADLTDRLIMYYRGARMYVTPTNVAFKPSKYPPPNVLLNFEDSYIPATASGKFIVILPVKYSNGDKNCLQFLPYIETVYHQVSPENITWQ